MLVAGDVVLALSASGESPEIVRLLEFAKTRSLFTIAMTGAPDSSVARAADLALSVAISREACPWGAPLAVLGEPPARFPGRPAARVRCNALFAAGSLTGRAGPLGAGWLLRLAVPALPLRTAPEFVVAALAVSLAVGLTAGVTPARRAAGLDPVDALRAE